MLVEVTKVTVSEKTGWAKIIFYSVSLKALACESCSLQFKIKIPYRGYFRLVYIFAVKLKH